MANGFFESQRLREKIPALVAVGDHDEIITPEEMQVMASQIAGAQFEVIANAGYLDLLEQPDAFNQVSMEFLNLFRFIGALAEPHC